MRRQINWQRRQRGPKFEIPALKKLLKTASLQRWQTDWDEGETGRLIHNITPKVSDIPSPWTKEVFQFATGHEPFPCFLKRFNLYRTNRWELGDPLHFATSCPFNISFHMTKPNDHLTKHWWKNCLSNKYSRSKIIQLVNRGGARGGTRGPCLGKILYPVGENFCTGYSTVVDK
ncbi:hypothetical protein AVEN_248635-1 [Araneus ventricosus]|uniref:Uncharacterized protein n=1 Tax=Araneus ventricosus TaxID=182803 RepID=A0A4Y2BZL4_ARAVE|nr:hypothetical protein AVEN_248635-1 [Araneus ventricosus]